MHTMKRLTSVSRTTLARPLVSSRVAANNPLKPLNVVSATLVTQAGSERTVDHIVRDHRELSDYYEQIKLAKDEDTKARWQNQFTWALARHSIAEELVVYPAMEKHLGDKGKEMAEKDRRDHRSVRKTLPQSAVR